MEKEPLKESGRFKVLIGTVFFEGLMFLVGWGSDIYGWSIPKEFLQQVSMTIGGIVGAFILGRSYRNTPGG